MKELDKIFQNCSKMEKEEPPKKKRKQAVRRTQHVRKACQTCRLKHRKCSKELPCYQCSSRGLVCSYSPHPPNKALDFLLSDNPATLQPPVVPCSTGGVDLSQKSDPVERSSFSGILEQLGLSDDETSTADSHNQDAKRLGSFVFKKESEAVKEEVLQAVGSWDTSHHLPPFPTNSSPSSCISLPRLPFLVHDYVVHSELTLPPPPDKRDITLLY